MLHLAAEARGRADDGFGWSQRASDRGTRPSKRCGAHSSGCAEGASGRGSGSIWHLRRAGQRKANGQQTYKKIGVRQCQPTPGCRSTMILGPGDHMIARREVCHDVYSNKSLNPHAPTAHHQPYQ